jgi:hypothetical protein
VHLINIIAQSSWFFTENLLDQLDPYILLIHEDSTDVGHKLILRFQNGFGIEIIQPFFFTKTPPVFKVLVLRFLGARIDDSIRVQYSSSAKGNWVHNLAEIISLCRQVACLQPGPLPKSRAVVRGLEVIMGRAETFVLPQKA